MGDKVRLSGQTFLTSESADGEAELNNRIEVTLDGDRTRWLIHGLPLGGKGSTVESTSPVVSGHVRRVVAALAREARRAVVRPVPKPTSRQRAPEVPPDTPRSCPACNGEGWLGDALTSRAWECGLCDGGGVVTARRAAEWRQR